ncbi:MAG: outer membrane lipoprotein-sorting protein [Elusimicrobiota bacterium]
MKRTLLLVVALLCAALASASPAGAAEKLTARQIMQKQKDLHRTSSEIEHQKMVLIDRRDKKENRELRRYNLEVKKDVYKYLIIFLAPKDIRGTSLLTWQHEDAPDDQWLFLPAAKKLKRVAEGSKKGYFMGTDFTYEDLSPEPLDDNKYKLLREEECPGKEGKGKDCWVIESVPANEEVLKASGYSKKHLWVRQDIFFTAKIEFFNKRGKHVKTQVMMDVDKVEGTIYRAGKALMDHETKKHKTLMVVTKREINAKIDKQLFSERSVLKQEGLR